MLPGPMPYLLVLLTALSAFAAAPGRTTSPPRQTDAQIEQTIRASFAKSKISADHFTVHVKGGVATIEGKTDIIQRKGWATRYARLGGATLVVNNIQINEAAKERARAKLAAARAKMNSAPAKRAESKQAPVPTKPASTVASSASSNAPAPIKRAQIKH